MTRCLALLLLLAACTGVERRTRAPDAGHMDAAVATDAATTDAATPLLDADPTPTDATPADATTDAAHDGDPSPDAGRDAGTTPRDLDPELAVPPEGNPTCTTPGASCGGAQVCRYYSSTEGRCESCTTCGNLNAPCTAGDQCDILFVCYRGRCTNFCTLGTYECGPIEDCVDIGHPTRGACRP